ncbi:MAG: hypothetical protein RIS92_977 [Verrucomicrobiota bacterium]
MIPTHSHLHRRTVLRGLGASLALPWLEGMGPLATWANAEETTAKVTPNRMAILYIPNGVHMPDWRPTEGPLAQLPKTLASLEPHKDYLLPVSGLTADKARANGDGGGDHARALSAFLTGAQPKKTDGADIRAGISVDQVAAAAVGDRTRLGSLEIGCEQGSMAGNCDSGYSCVYSSTMSWQSASEPLPKEVNPKLIFERIFGSGSSEERKRRDAQRKSIIDFVRQDVASLTKQLGSQDRRKLDEYVSSVRDLELRIERAAAHAEPKQPEGFAAPEGIPQDYQSHIRLLCDLLVLAFQTDSTRIATFVMANEGSNKAYPFVGVKEGHHDLSHHGNNAEKLEKIAAINRFHIEQFAYLLEKLKSTPEGDGNLLDHSMIAIGSGNSDGNRHNHDDLPILLAGKGNGTLSTGRHLVIPGETPLNNLWLGILNRMDVKTARLGDSTGELKGLKI